MQDYDTGRKIRGPLQQHNGSWKVQKNQGIEQIIAETSIMGENKAQHLRWLSHLLRIIEDRCVQGVSWNPTRHIQISLE